MIFSGLFGKGAGTAVAIFDIGSSSVGSALVVIGNEKPQVIYTNRIPIPFQKDIDSEKFTKDFLTALVDAALDLKTVAPMRFKEHGIRHISEVSAVFASPWCISEGLTVRLQKEKEFLITKDLIDKTVQTETERYANEREGEHPILIERHAVGVVLNGYRFDDPYGKKALQADISSFLSFIPAPLEKKVREIIQSALPGARIHAHSFPMTLFSTVRDVFTDLDDALLIDIRGEVTDISIMANGVLTTTVSFPMGEHTILRMLTEGNPRMPEEQRSKLKLFLEGNANEAVASSFEQELSSLKGLFEMSFKKALEPIAVVKSLPVDVVLTVEGSSSKWFVDTLSTLDMGELILGGGKPRIHLLEAGTLQNTYTASSEVRSDVLIAIETLFVQKMHRLG